MCATKGKKAVNHLLLPVGMVSNIVLLDIDRPLDRLGTGNRQ